jgi:predicted GIY-YIG superfamily endonuclease
MLNGIVYKLKSKNPNITEFYIGSSVDMKARITKHKTIVIIQIHKI